ncbi:MAG: MFS transporter, partial [Desulfovibrionaceae bacterium]|nr:MFS transporter [Desulfovibrionaceae bacterium]
MAAISAAAGPGAEAKDSPAEEPAGRKPGFRAGPQGSAADGGPDGGPGSGAEGAEGGADNESAGPRTRLGAVLGWLAVLLVSMCVYDALLCTSIKKELWEGDMASARLAAQQVAGELGRGLAVGKRLTGYAGLGALLADTTRASGLPVAVYASDGRLIAAGAAGENGATITAEHFLAGHPTVREDGLVIRADEDGRTVLAAVDGPSGRTVGWVGARLDAGPVAAGLESLLRHQILQQAICAGAGLVLLLLVLNLPRYRAGRRRGMHLSVARPTRKIYLGVLVLVLAACGLCTLHGTAVHYTASLRQDAARTGDLLARTLHRLNAAGVPQASLERAGGYLSGIAALHDNAVSLKILAADGRVLADTAPGGEELLEGGRSWPLLKPVVGEAGRSWEAGAGLSLHMGLLRGHLVRHLVDVALDTLTMTAIAVIFMLEVFNGLARCLHFFRRRAQARAARTAKGPAGAVHAAGGERDSRLATSMMRPLGFLAIFAMDLSISFIPLRMADLVPEGTAGRSILLGLPLSASVAMTALAAVGAGLWIRRHGSRPPLMAGLVLLGLGDLGSMLAQAPWQFIAARGFSGAGYGLMSITAKACTVREGMLADMYAGFCSGGLCGCAMGAMLAERFGYEPVFLISACALLCLAPLPILFVRAGRPADSAGGSASAASKKCPSLAETRRLLADRKLLCFVLLALIPTGMLVAGFFGFFMPLHLKNGGAAQSDIGRICMLNSFMVIYFGPLFGTLVAKTRDKTGLLCAAVLL